MVTVVNRIPDQSVVKRVVCRSCGCTLEYVPKDVQEDYDTDYTGGKDMYKYIKCPECVHQVRV
jgi:ribosomal protein S27E